MKRAISMILFAVVAASATFVAVLGIDYAYYGRLVVPTFNIFMYNAIGNAESEGEGGTGDDLYGVEDWKFYIKNLLLNFNCILLLAGLMPFACIFGKNKNKNKNDTKTLLTILAPGLLWVLLTFSRPHKEERFLFPVYPLICVAASITMVKLCRNKFVVYVLLILIGGLSESRKLALHKYYFAPLSVYGELHGVISSRGGQGGTVKVCVGGEWHRFPSHFFLPENSALHFLKTGFGGQLPQHFGPGGSRETAMQSFNAMNREEEERYEVGNIGECDYVVVLETEGDEVLAQVEEAGVEFERIIEHDFLDAEKTSALGRILYLPYISDSYNVYAKYSVYERQAKILE